MINNLIKSNWTIEQLGWTVYLEGDIGEWNGLTSEFLEIIKLDPSLLNDQYIKNWYNASEQAMGNFLKKAK